MEIARVYFDVHMGLAFNGLKKIMKKTKVDPDSLPDGKFTVFINRKQTKFKCLVGSNILVYHDNGQRRFPLEVVSEFPRFFNGQKLDFTRAVEAAIRKKYDPK